MKAQYIGDINDYRKYALLRAFQGAGVPVGIHWMLTPDDASSDGGKRAYLREAGRWRHHDPDLFDGLLSLENSGRAAIRQVEALEALTGMAFFGQTIPDDLNGRRDVMRAAHKALSGSDLVFFDPDNGFETPSKRKGSRTSSKYVYSDEIKAEYIAGKSVLLYQHYPRVERRAFEQNLATQLRSLCPGAVVDILATAHVAFVLVTGTGGTHVRSTAEDFARSAGVDFVEWRPTD